MNLEPFYKAFMFSWMILAIALKSYLWLTTSTTKSCSSSIPIIHWIMIDLQKHNKSGSPGSQLTYLLAEEEIFLKLLSNFSYSNTI